MSVCIHMVKSSLKHSLVSYFLLSLCVTFCNLVCTKTREKWSIKGRNSSENSSVTGRNQAGKVGISCIRNSRYVLVFRETKISRTQNPIFSKTWFSITKTLYYRNHDLENHVIEITISKIMLSKSPRVIEILF